jgi:hypothetical protein
MTDTERTIERITSANPVPSPDAFPSSALSSADLLARIDERSTAMTETLTPIRDLEPEKPPRRARGPFVAVAVAAAVVLVIGLASLFFLNGDATAPADPSPTLESPLGADAEALDVIAAVTAAWDAGDLATADSLIHPDSPYFSPQAASGFAAEVWYREASGAVVERDCALGTPVPGWDTDLFDNGGVVVTCEETIISGTEPGTVIGGGITAAEVKDGWVLNPFIGPGYVGAISERGNENQFIGQYRNWVRERFPDDFDELFTAVSMIVGTPEAQAKHREFMPFFVADTGPRGEAALPADTPLIEVVATFTERYDSGDINGYEALFHPLSGYASGSNAQDSWFSSVTGMSADRDCTLVEPTQVRCDEVVYSGLLPGTVVGEFTTLWNGAAGWIWSIEFDGDAPQRATDPALAPGVKEYRDWVKTNAPEAADTLFVAGLAMRLDTEEARDAHREMISSYLAAISN